MRHSHAIGALLGCFWFVAVPQGVKAQTTSPCGVPAFTNPYVPTALSSMTPSGPVIVYNGSFFQGLGANGQLLFRWMLAHECAHHLNGDVVGSMLNPQGYLIITPEIELRADCDSAKYLRSINDLAALNYAILFWERSGNNSTGPNYPTGVQRAQTLRTC